MDESDVIDSAHKTNINRLIEEFGEHQECRIREVYTLQREADESSARITDFTPIFTYRTVREILRND